MTEQLIVKTSNIWDGQDDKSKKLLDLTLYFPSLNLNRYNSLPSHSKKRLASSIQKEIQSLANKRFGEDAVKVDLIKLNQGSLEVAATLLFIYKFFLNYDSLRKGVISFSKDLTLAANHLKTFIKQKYNREVQRVNQIQTKKKVNVKNRIV